MNIEACISEGFLQKIAPNFNAAEKELLEGEYDIGKAKKSLGDDDAKWAIVKAYYTMFHAAKALLFSIGLKERRHFAVRVVLEDLSRQGVIESFLVSSFGAAMEAREDADYRHIYSKETAETIVEDAENFLKTARSAVNKLKSNGKKKDR